MKSRPGNKGKKYVPHQKKKKLSAVSPEVLFAQKLAANDPTHRNRAVRKLQKWLKVRCDNLTSDEILRIWKGLHYCFWMSDKPLVQEELAETISHLIHCFPVSSENALHFIEAGLITEGREWVGIDQWRMDKFMMFLRRFLRQILTFLSKDKWSKVKEVTDIFHSKVISNNEATLGFRLHFTDVYLEEVAKVGGEALETELIIKLILPFTKELAEGDDDRLSKHINERIFQHLMRQSDIGVASEEALNGDEEVEDDDCEDNSEGEEEEDEDMPEIDAKDPRAGGVSVALPQLKPNFSALADFLFKIGSDKKISSRRRTLLYDLTKQFKDLAQDVYPLIPDLSQEEAQIPKVKVGQVAKKKVQEELAYQEKVRKEREEFKKSLKRKSKDGNSCESEKASTAEKKRKTEETLEEKADESPLPEKNETVSQAQNMTLSTPSEKKIKKKKSKESKKNEENEEEESPKVLRKKKKKKDKEGEPLTKKVFSEDNDWNAADAKISSTPPVQKSALFLKKSKALSEEPKKVGNKKKDLISLVDKKRRISFAMSQNKCQSFNDIDRSMQDSPDIPYLPEKKPKHGVLKSKSASSTPVQMTKAALSYNTMMNGKSKAAKKLGLNSNRLLFQF